MSIIKGSVGPSGTNMPTDVMAVQTLLIRHKAWLTPVDPPALNGLPDKPTTLAIVAFQKNAAAFLKPDGIVSPNGFTIKRLELPTIPRPRHAVFKDICWEHANSLSKADYDAAAKTLGIEAAAAEAVARTETKRDAWDSLGRPSILFERHYFSKLTKKAFDRTHPDIASPTVTPAGGYGLYRAQYPKLLRAAMLDETAALQSASWGSFQIMGANFSTAGFPRVEDFVDAMLISERRHLDAFVAFVGANATMLKALRGRDWTTFARLYNGPDFRTNQYDTQMKANYDELVKAQPNKPAPTPGP